jgi:hypothetical protein
MGFGFRPEYIREKIVFLVLALLFVPVADCAPDRSFHLMETSIADIHKAMQAKIKKLASSQAFFVSIGAWIRR